MTEKTPKGPFIRLGGSSKAWLAALGIVAMVVLPRVSDRPWQEIGSVVLGIAWVVKTLIESIAREDAASKSAPTSVAVGHLDTLDVKPEPPILPVANDVEEPK